MVAIVKRRLKPIYWQVRARQAARRLDAPAPRLIYALTPPPKLSNIGDQAQVVAIRAWMSRHFPDHAVIELDKDEVLNCLDRLKRHVHEDDIFVLHSGGNLGDRGRWSETARRLVIESFPKHRIVSLPQTIHFSDTETGRRERETSARIYNAHPNLTVIARDRQSHAHAKDIFADCRLDAAPDFVLGYDWPAPHPETPTNGRVLFCLRDDSESAMDSTGRQALLEAVGRPHEVFDTTLQSPIPMTGRQEVLDRTLRMFESFDAVVTDRFHGLIFAVLTRRPTVVLPTVDHKLTSAFDWFDGIGFLRFAHSTSEVREALAAVERTVDRAVPDWPALHFDRLATYVSGR